MPTKREFVGYHKISGERIVKVHNPNGLLSVYVVENGSGPYAGFQVTKSEIVRTIEEVVGVATLEDAPEGVSGVMPSKAIDEDESL